MIPTGVISQAQLVWFLILACGIVFSILCWLCLFSDNAFMFSNMYSRVCVFYLHCLYFTFPLLHTKGKILKALTRNSTHSFSQTSCFFENEAFPSFTTHNTKCGEFTLFLLVFCVHMYVSYRKYLYFFTFFFSWSGINIIYSRATILLCSG